jgi:hypothetical protein
MDGLNLDVDREFTSQADSFVKQSGRLFSPEDEIRNLQSKIPSKSVLQGALFGSELSEKAALAQLHEQESQGGEKTSSAEMTEVDANLAFEFGFQNYAGLFAPKSNTLNEKDILRLSSLSASGTTGDSREFRIGSHCDAFGRIIHSNGPQGSIAEFLAEGEGSDSDLSLPSLNFPSLHVASYTGNLRDFTPPDSSSFSSVGLGGSFTLDSLTTPDESATGQNWVHLKENNWISPLQWSFTESFVAVYDFSDSASDSGDLEDLEEGRSENSSDGNPEPDGDEESGLDASGDWQVSGTASRRGMIRFSITISQGMISSAAAGVAWVISLSYRDRITVEVNAGGNAAFTPSESNSSNGEGDSGGSSEYGTSGDSGGSDSEPEFPDDFSASSSWNVGLSTMVTSNGVVSLSVIPAVGLGEIPELAISAAVSSELNGNSRVNYTWNAASQSGNLSLPDLPAGPGENPLSRCPPGGDGDPFGVVEGTGFASMAGGQGVGTAGGGVSGEMTFTGSVRNGEFVSLLGEGSSEVVGDSGDTSSSFQLDLGRHHKVVPTANGSITTTFVYKSNWAGDGNDNGDGADNSSSELSLGENGVGQIANDGEDDVNSNREDNGKQFEDLFAERIVLDGLNVDDLRTHEGTPFAGVIDYDIWDYKDRTTIKFRSDTTGEGLGTVEAFVAGDLPETAQINTSIEGERTSKFTYESEIISNGRWRVNYDAPAGTYRKLDDDWSIGWTLIIDTKTTGEGNAESQLQSNGSVNWQFDATVATEVDVDYKYHEYREIENEESDADGMLTIKAGNYTRRAELVGGTDSTAQINGNGNTGVDGVGAVSNITTNTTSTNNGDTEVAIEVEIVNSDPADPYVWPSWDVFSPTQIEEMLNGTFSAPDETGNTLEGDGGSDGQGDDGLGNGSRFWFDDPDDSGSNSQQHLRAGRMARDLGLLGTQRHLEAAHGAKQMQSTFANATPGVGAVLGAVDGANGEDSITGEKLTYFQRGLGLLAAVPVVGGMVKSTGRVAKTTRAVDKVADTIGHTRNSIADVSTLKGRQLASEFTGNQIKRFRREMQGQGGYGDFPPIKIAEIDGKKIIIDGHHRARAAGSAGIKNVPVEIFDLPPDVARKYFQQAAEAAEKLGLPF